MGSNINGFQNENNIINYLNNSKYNELNSNIQKFIKFLYPKVKSDDIIYAFPGIIGQKPDMIININSITKYISIKIGNGNSVHQESIDLFINFLTSLNLSERAKIELLKYHWADGTTNGTGKIRVSSAEYKLSHQKELRIINNEVNKSEFLRPIATRILFKGKDYNYDLVDAIYYGDVLNGHWASRSEILRYFTSRNFYSDSIHFGPLNYQIWNRCLNLNPNTENRRSVMQVKWGSLLQDLMNIESERDNNE